jgi:signal transduction histidine kinase
MLQHAMIMKHKAKQRFEVRYKIQLPVILFIALLSLFMAVYFPGQLKEALRNSHRKEVQSLAKGVARSMKIALDNEDWAAIPKAEEYDVFAIALIAEDGSTFSASPDDFVYRPEADDESVIYADYPISTDVFTGSVVVGSSASFINQQIAGLRATIISVAVITLFLGILFAVWQAGLIVRPLSLLRLAAIKVGHGDLDARVDRTTNDEIGDLAVEFGKMLGSVRLAQQSVQEANAELQAKNRLLEAERRQLARTLEHLKATQAQLVQSEKMAALGQLIAGIAHEINTPLGAIRASISNIERALEHTLLHLPVVLRGLDSAEQDLFFALVQEALTKYDHLSAREERERKRVLLARLESEGVPHADDVAGYFADMGLFDDLGRYDTLLRLDTTLDVLRVAARLVIQQRNSRNIETAVDRASKIVFALKSYSHRDPGGAASTAIITDGIETVLTLYHNQLKHGIEVQRRFSPVPPILCFPDELNQVWTNLIHNAIHAMDNHGILEVEVEAHDAEIVVRIIDSGRGIPDDIQERIFEPFFTTKTAGEGSGLGLDIVRRIIEKHDGNVSVESLPGRTAFTITLPVRRPDA